MRRISNSQGFSIVEALVGLTLLSIVSLSVTRSSIMAIQTREKTLREYAATQLAAEKIEELAATDPATLDDSDDLSETVYKGSISFTRVADITVNADDSRTAEVTVDCDSDKFTGSASLEVTLPLWGMN